MKKILLATLIFVFCASFAHADYNPYTGKFDPYYRNPYRQQPYLGDPFVPFRQNMGVYRDNATQKQHFLLQQKWLELEQQRLEYERQQFERQRKWLEDQNQ